MSVGPVHAGYPGSARGHERPQDSRAPTYKPLSAQGAHPKVSDQKNLKHYRAKPAEHASQPSESADTSNIGRVRAEAGAVATQPDDPAARVDLTLDAQNGAPPANALHAVGGATDPYLSRAGVVVTPESLAALYEAEPGAPAVAPSVGSAALDLTPPTSSSAATAYQVVQPILAKISAILSSTDAVDAPPAGEGLADHARTKLFLDLTAAPARRYGSIPVIVSGQLIELQFVALQVRQGAAAAPLLRRLQLTLKTPAFGSIQVLAEARGNRLSVMFTGTDAGTAEDLTAHTGGVTELLSRLGWQVDSVTVAIGDMGNAVPQILYSVRDDNSLDQWL